MRKIAIAYIAHDGFTSLYTGVGSVARDFLLSFPSVSKVLKKKYKGYAFDLYATTIKYNEKCFGFSADVKKATENITSKNKNVHLIELLNGSNGDESYATIEFWKAASISGATFVYTLSLQYDKVIVISVDTPFAQVANYFFKQYDSKNVLITWLVQSTVLIHRENPDKLTIDEGKRYVWEKELVDLSNSNKFVFLSPVGDFVSKHLIREYGARPDKMILIKNSLNLNRLRSNITGQQTIKKLLIRLGIPIDRPLVFSFGRTEPYKGLDLVLENARKLIKEKGFFALILCSPHNNNENDPVVKTLKKFERKHSKDVKVATSQDFSLPHLIMQYGNLKILAILSRSEPFGLIPIESRFYKNKNLVLVVSNVGGLLEQVADGIDGFITSLDRKSIEEKFTRAAELSIKEKETIALNAYKKILNEYDQEKVDIEFISRVLDLV